MPDPRYKVPNHIGDEPCPELCFRYCNTISGLRVYKPGRSWRDDLALSCGSLSSTASGWRVVPLTVNALRITMREENVHLDRGYLIVPSGKTTFARRNIPLTGVAIAVLKERIAEAQGPYLFGCRGHSTEPLASIQKAHEGALRDAAITPRFRLYDLRHTFGSRSAMAGVDLATLKELMGHSKLSTTMRYIHPTPERKRDAVRKLERFNNEHGLRPVRGTGSPHKSPHSWGVQLNRVVLSY